MELKDYLKENGMKSNFFAKKIGVACATLSGWLKKTCSPSKKNILLIEKATNGKVKPKDWFTEIILTKGNQEENTEK